MSAGPFDQLLDSPRLVICVGTGGVGKTTTSAALALRAAYEGHRVLVMTIDPARRLATAMGLDALGNEPQRVAVAEDARGTLDAMMLDAQATFDDLIRRTAGDKADRILENRLYRLMVDQLSGTQEYMALERLFDLYTSRKWDVIVLDTPPATNALEFFDAPRRTARMFDERVMRWLLPESRSDAGLLRRVLNPGAVVLKLLSIVGGEAFVDELAEFFAALSIVRASFEERGHAVGRILKDRDTRYVLVASPDARRVEEALSLGRRLDSDLGTRMFMVVLNRSHHLFHHDDEEAFGKAAGAEAPPVPEAFRAWYADLAALGARDRAGIERMRRLPGDALLRLIPAFDRPIHTLEELGNLAAFVFDRPLEPALSPPA